MAQAGAPPGDYQLWELRLLARQRNLDEWDKVAFLAMYVSAPYSRVQQTVTTLNPFRRAAAEQGLAALDARARALGLPKDMTDEQMEQRWDEVKGCLSQEQQER